MPIYEVQVSPPSDLQSGGPRLPVDIALPQILVDRLNQEGFPVPPPISGHALIDTGASVSVVDTSVITRLQINPIGVTTIGTAAGRVRRNLYPSRFIFPRLVVDLSPIIGADLSSFQIIALIGRDILSRFLFIYHGPAGRITLAF